MKICKSVKGAHLVHLLGPTFGLVHDEGDIWMEPRPAETRPSKQCKSLIDVLILSNIWRGIFCGGDEKWINYRAVLVGN